MALGRLINVQENYVHGVKRSPLKVEYDSAGEYLDHRRENVFKFRDAAIQDDGNGIPQNNYRWGGPYYYIVTIGHYGLECFSKYRYFNDRAFLDKARRVADWLCDNQLEDGGWDVSYDHDWFPRRVAALQAPWRSAMGQGLAMSFLARMYMELGSLRYLEAARLGIGPYLEFPENGGVQADLFGRVWFEEYPTSPSSFVLNGYMYSLLGLYDAAVLLSDGRCKEYFDNGVQSLESSLCFYDLGYGTSYDLTHLSASGEPPNVARWQYHWIHVQLLSTMNLISDFDFGPVVDRWDAYLRGGVVKHN